MNYAGSLKKKNENQSRKKGGANGQPVTNERSSKEILAILRPNEIKGRGSRFQNEGPSTSKVKTPGGLGVKTPGGFKLERNFPRPGFVVFQERESDENRRKRLIKAIEVHESPFKWNAAAPKAETSVSKLKNKIQEVQEERVGLFKWRNFCLNLVLSYEYYQASDLESSLEIIERLQSNILKIASKDETDYFFIGIYDALDHVMNASKAFLLLKMDKLAEAEKLLLHIQPVERMRRSARAGMYGTQAAVSMEYGLPGNQRALKLLSSALELDKSTAEWYFLQGKCLGRIRRLVNWNDSVSKEELDSLYKAHRKDENNTVYLIYLAQSIRDKAKRDLKSAPGPTIKKSKKTYRDIKQPSEESKKAVKAFYAAYYKMMEAVEKSPNNVRVLIRAASVMLKLPFQIVNVKLASDWLDTALEKAPHNSMAHHVKGMLLERFDVDAEKAMEELRIAEQLGNYAAALGVVKMAFRLDHDNIIERFEHLATVFTDRVRLQNTYAQAGSYLLFVKKNLIGAARYFIKVIDLNPQSYNMKYHSSMFLRMEHPVNLLHLLQTELSECVVWETFSKEDQKVLKTLSIKMYSLKEQDTKQEKVYIRNVIEQSYQLLDKEEKARSKPPRKLFVWKGKKAKKKDKDVKKKEGETASPVDLNDKLASLVDWNDKIEPKLTPEGMSLADKFMVKSQLANSSFSLRRYPSNSSISSDSSSVCSEISRASDRSRYYDKKSSRESLQEGESEFGDFPKRTSSITDTNFAPNLAVSASSDSESVKSEGSATDLMEMRRGSKGRSSLVMDRVKQSYRMLDYKKGDQPPQPERTGHKLNRTDSTQSLHTEPGSSGLRQRTDSVQSLNSLDVKFKPSFSFASSRSSSFMPKFAKK